MEQGAESGLKTFQEEEEERSNPSCKTLQVFETIRLLSHLFIHVIFFLLNAYSIRKFIFVFLYPLDGQVKKEKKMSIVINWCGWMSLLFLYHPQIFVYFFLIRPNS